MRSYTNFATDNATHSPLQKEGTPRRRCHTIIERKAFQEGVDENRHHKHGAQLNQNRIEMERYAADVLHHGLQARADKVRGDKAWRGTRMRGLRSKRPG